MMSQLTGTIFDIKKYAIHDGPGIRTTVFFQGCPLNCWWCHNPESQSRKPVLLYRANRCILCGACVETCPQAGIKITPSTDGREDPEVRTLAITDRSKCDVCGQCAEICYPGAREISGKQMTVDEVISEIERDMPFYEQSGGGVTFSGGEPLLQRKFLAALLRESKKRAIHTVVDTSGYAAWDAFKSLVDEVDLFLYDLKLMDDERHKQVTGVSNKLILDNLQRLIASGAQVEVRVPLIPGINDDSESLGRAAAYLAKLTNIPRIELMTYHDIAESKYQALGMTYKLSEIIPPSETCLQEAASYFVDQGLSVKGTI